MTETLLVGVVVPLGVAAVCDLRTREIPNWSSLTVLLLAVVAAATGAAGIRIWMVGGGGLLGLVVGSLLFQYGAFGGGDAKLIAALGAFVGPFGLLLVLFWMALAGGVLALIAMARGQRDYAYGPAIAAGYLGYLIWPAGLLQRLVS